MKDFLERLKSPVVWSAVLTVVYSQAELLRESDCTVKDLLLSAVVVVCAAFAALNNPTDRDNM